VDWREIGSEERRIAINAIQSYEQYLALRHQSEELAGGISWREIAGREYLIRVLDGYGHVRSLGPRSPKTDELYSDFTHRKKAIKSALAETQAELERRAKFCIAAGVNRVPSLTARIIRRLDEVKLLGDHLVILGSNAIFAYEMKAGVFLKSGLMQTDDLDTLLEENPPLQLAGSVSKAGLLGILKRVDRTFDISSERSFRAVNSRTFMVDLIKPPARKRSKIGRGRDLVASTIEGLQWLADAPKMTQIAIGEDGFPVRFVVPDPRVFALHKLWLSLQTDRSPLKRKRDFRQGGAVGQIALEYLDLSFEDAGDPVIACLAPPLRAQIRDLLERIHSRSPGAARRPRVEPD
jgi:hypothetical protein